MNYIQLDQTYRDRQPAHRGRRRYMSPTRSRSRSPHPCHLPYIHRGRANPFAASTSIDSYAPTPTSPVSIPPSSPTPTSLSGISPDTEPMFQMSPIILHCLPPPPKNREPINVMTLRNYSALPTRSTRPPRPKSTRATAPVNIIQPPLLYTFPRPNPNSKPNPNSNNFASVKKPFGLVSQNQIYPSPSKLDDDGDSNLETATPNAPPSLFLDLSPTPPPILLPWPNPTKQQQQHVRIAQDPLKKPDDDAQHSQTPCQTTPKKKRSRTPMPSPKTHDAPKPVLTNVVVTVSQTGSSTSPSSSPQVAPTPLRRMPSLPIPIPYHAPRDEDTGLFEDVSVGQSDVEGGDGDVADDDDAAHQEENGSEPKSPPFNHLGLQLPFSPLPYPSTSPSLQLHPLRSSNPVSDSDTGSTPQNQNCHSLSSSLAPNVRFGSDEDSALGGGEEKQMGDDGSSDEDTFSASTLLANENGGRHRMFKRRRRSKEIDQVVYFENPGNEVKGGNGVCASEGENSARFSPNLPFLPAFQTFDSLQPVFPAFSIAYEDDDVDTDPRHGSDIIRSHFESDSEVEVEEEDDRTPSSAVSKEPEEFGEGFSTVTMRGEKERINPWLSLLNSNNGYPTHTFATADTENRHTYRNGKADLSVFNPPALPPFGSPSPSFSPSSADSASGSASASDYESLTPHPDFTNNNIKFPLTPSHTHTHSHPESQSPPFLSFPISVFHHHPRNPYGAVGGTTVPVLSPAFESVSGSGVKSGGDEDEDVGVSFRSSVYGGFRDQAGEGRGSMDTVMEPVLPAAPASGPVPHTNSSLPKEELRSGLSERVNELNELNKMALAPVPPVQVQVQVQKRVGEKERGKGKGAYGLLKKIVGRVP